ncbi:MAG: hypothetical protein RJA55_1323 [Acidobacteriota bacterium]|jgi:hypothetical protein
MKLALLIAVAAMGLSVAAAETRLTPGAPMPALKGDDLAGLSVTLPDAARGRVALVAFGFSYASRTPVEEWTAHLRQGWAADARVTWYQLPMIGGFGRLAKPFITGGMKKDTPEQYRGNAVVVFGGVGPWKERLAVRDDKLAYLVLIDTAGVVRWMHAGAFDAGKAAELDAQVRQLLDPPQGINARWFQKY